MAPLGCSAPGARATTAGGGPKWGPNYRAAAPNQAAADSVITDNDSANTSLTGTWGIRGQSQYSPDRPRIMRHRRWRPVGVLFERASWCLMPTHQSISRRRPASIVRGLEDRDRRAALRSTLLESAARPAGDRTVDA